MARCRRLRRLLSAVMPVKARMLQAMPSAIVAQSMPLLPSPASTAGAEVAGCVCVEPELAAACSPVGASSLGWT